LRFVYLICLKYVKTDELAKDLSMQVFEQVCTDVLKFEIKNFKSWLHVVSKNTCLMYLRKNKSRPQTSSIDESPMILQITNTNDDSMDVSSGHNIQFSTNENFVLNSMEMSSEMHPDNNLEVKLEQLEKAVNLLEGNQKSCIKLFYLNEKTYKEVAEITGLDLNEVKSNIQNGKRNLKNYLINNELISLYLFFIINYMNKVF
jgi:RNA polymerase sigma-70 factor (ECF subfamily)